MSSQTSALSRLTGACIEELRVALGTSITSSEPLRLLEGQLVQGQLDLQWAAEPLNHEVRSVLSQLAPAELALGDTLLQQAATVRLVDQRQAEELVVRAGQSFRQAASAAADQVDRLTRQIVSSAAVEAGRELGYAVTVAEGEHFTGLDMRQGHHVLLAVVGDDGTFVDDQAGLLDGSCQDRRSSLAAAMSRRGVRFSEESPQLHARYDGGELIHAAAASDPVLARGAVAAAERRRASVLRRKRTTAQGARVAVRQAELGGPR